MIDKSLYYKYLFIDFDSATPLYVQLANAITRAIEDKYLDTGESLPSINELSSELELSRDTIEKAYKRLKKLNILDSIPGKGYFVLDNNINLSSGILLIFNKLSTHKKIIYDAFVNALGDNYPISFYIYNNDYHQFKKIIEKKVKQGNYAYYVIIPHFLGMEDKAIELINTLPKEKLILLDKRLESVTGNYSTVYEDFEKDIFTSLDTLKTAISPYKKINIVFPEKTYHPTEIITGLINFCKKEQMEYSVLSKLELNHLAKDNLYITLMEQDLVLLIEYALEKNWTVGVDIGVISYNEIGLKKIILNGITTFSTDFEWMGKKAAGLILNNKVENIAVPFSVFKRASI